MYSLGKDLASEILPKYAIASTSATAGGSGDNAEVNGATLDVQAIAGKPNSVCFLVAATSTLAATKTLKITANLQDSADGTNFTDITDPAVILTLTGATGGSTETGAAKLGFDLTKARRYVRIQATPDLNATGTDTAVMTGVAVFGGFQEL